MKNSQVGFIFVLKMVKLGDIIVLCMIGSKGAWQAGQPIEDCLVWSIW